MPRLCDLSDVECPSHLHGALIHKLFCQTQIAGERPRFGGTGALSLRRVLEGAAWGPPDIPPPLMRPARPSSYEVDVGYRDGDTTSRCGFTRMAAAFEVFCRSHQEELLDPAPNRAQAACCGPSEASGIRLSEPSRLPAPTDQTAVINRTMSIRAVPTMIAKSKATDQLST